MEFLGYNQGSFKDLMHVYHTILITDDKYLSPVLMTVTLHVHHTFLITDNKYLSPVLTTATLQMKFYFFGHVN